MIDAEVPVLLMSCVLAGFTKTNGFRERIPVITDHIDLLIAEIAVIYLIVHGFDLSLRYYLVPFPTSA